MKIFIATLYLSMTTLLTFGQLPPVAQALYTEMYNTNTIKGNYAITNGAVAIATPDSNSFYLQWFPNSTPSADPLVITLHGTGANAFDEFYAWHTRALANGVGIIAIQYYRGAASVYPNNYFNDTTLYNFIDTALTRINYPAGKALYHGFSRGAARSYAIAFYDNPLHGGKKYFCTVMSNAGCPDSTYSLYYDINNNISGYGHSLYNNYQWAMFSGGLDTNAGSTPQKMLDSKNWVIANGGNVGVFIYDPNLPHGGFHMTPAYIDSVLHFYLSCYQTVNVTEINKGDMIASIYPNPFSTQTTLQTAEPLKNATLTLVNIYGQTVSQIENINGQTIILNRDNLTSGLYFARLTQDNNVIAANKIVIAD